MTKMLFVFGTRPEAIKFAPLIKAFQSCQDLFTVRICITSQHKEMLQQVLHFFKIVPDIDLDVMKPSQSLADMSVNILSAMQQLLTTEKPDIIFVQGDTTTAYIAALAAFYHRIPVAHLEAGLRSFNNYSPFPEEVNRKMITTLATYHFPPTVTGKNNLLAEGIKNNVYVTGNTVIDALESALQIIDEKGDEAFKENYPFIQSDKKIILVTGHRRESFGEGFENICRALKTIANNNVEVQIIYPVHLNPHVQEPVSRLLNDTPNIHLLPPVDYETLIRLMRLSYIILTDSGGIQEEAPSLKKPVCVMRDVTERTEGIESGSAILVGTSPEAIVKNVEMLLTNESVYQKMAGADNPYGDGKSSDRIVQIMKAEFHQSN